MTLLTKSRGTGSFSCVALEARSRTWPLEVMCFPLGVGALRNAQVSRVRNGFLEFSEDLWWWFCWQALLVSKALKPQFSERLNRKPHPLTEEAEEGRKDGNAGGGPVN